MNPSSWLTILATIASSSVVSVAITQWANRKKTTAQTQNLEVSATVKLGEGWEHLVENLRNEVDRLKEQYEGLEAKYNELRVDYEQLVMAYATLRKENEDIKLKNNVT